MVSGWTPPRLSILAILIPEELPPAFEHRLQAIALCRQVTCHPLRQIGTIRIVVAGNELFGIAADDMVPAGIEQQVHRGTGHLVVRVVTAVLVAASGVVQM